MEILGPDALGELLDRHGAALELFALQWTRNAADVVQTAFVKLAIESPSPEQPTPWLYRVVRNGAISASRAESRRNRHESTFARNQELWFQPSPEDRLDAVEATQALTQLPQIQREVIVARLWGGLTYQEIATALDLSSSAAQRHYEAGLQALREKLGVTWLKNPR